VHAGAILFDLDGVLVDSRGAIAFVWREWAAADACIAALPELRVRVTGTDLVIEF
jgi:beta-phosphoglucomutase-like phosphatase (HAD superfamily)